MKSTNTMPLPGPVSQPNNFSTMSSQVRNEWNGSNGGSQEGQKSKDTLITVNATKKPVRVNSKAVLKPLNFSN